ncbi:ankyrin repeat domain containing protein [Stylonychia lemnae]|uniref:Ankyrin repeat domain containing protein n=1 Tax=Stylonychia lemnae TaxID=5949 RepID=A0A078B2V8_STYLE|nr:ankyrin repeat domain containing protein [Stylonychia lemnae]|eukprot:CDW87557.1 ankyrin repeat domain containing protein [Stylonychia lemnae]
MLDSKMMKEFYLQGDVQFPYTAQGGQRKDLFFKERLSTKQTSRGFDRYRGSSQEIQSSAVQKFANESSKQFSEFNMPQININFGDYQTIDNKNDQSTDMNRSQQLGEVFGNRKPSLFQKFIQRQSIDISQSTNVGVSGGPNAGGNNGCTNNNGLEIGLDLETNHNQTQAINTVRGSLYNNSIFKDSSVERDEVNGGLMTIQGSNITPEIAAQIVKNYLLPMFNGKRNIRGTSKKRKSQDDSTRQTIISEEQHANLDQLNDQNGKLPNKYNLNNTVYTELLLNQKLYKKLIDTDQKLEYTLEQMEELKNKNNLTEKYTLEQRQLIIRYQIENQILKNHIQKLSDEKKKLHIDIELLLENYKKLNEIFITSETKRKMILSTYMDTCIQKDKFQGYCKQLETENKLQDIQSVYLKEQYQLVSDSISKLSQYKMIQDQNDVSVEFLRREIEKQAMEKREVDAQAILATEEITMLKKRIERLKIRKVKLNQKICKNCNQEFIESENYNWSCRTHQSEYGGEMWWCCGRKLKDAPGCKFNKHQNKDDEEQEAKEFNDALHQETIKCFCCKQHGHAGRQCNRDPNLKTIQGIDLENQANLEDLRIHKVETDHQLRKKINYLEDFRKLVTHLISQQQEELDYAALNPNRIRRKPRPSDHIQNTLLQFDDYNYAELNHELKRGITRKNTSVKLDHTFSFNKLQSFREHMYQDESINHDGGDLDTIVIERQESIIDQGPTNEVTFDFDKIRQYQQKEPFEDVKELKYELALKQDITMKQNLIDILNYMPKRFSQMSIQNRSSKAGSVKGNKASQDKSQATLLTSTRIGLVFNQNSISQAEDEFGFRRSISNMNQSYDMMNNSRGASAQPRGILRKKSSIMNTSEYMSSSSNNPNQYIRQESLNDTAKKLPKNDIKVGNLDKIVINSSLNGSGNIISGNSGQRTKSKFKQ